MKIIYLIVLWIPCTVVGQQLKSSESYIRFFSSAPIEDIAAENTRARSIIDAEKGQVAFIVPVSGFEFEKALMQEHFNENYLETDKYPNATFTGTIDDWEYSLGKKEVDVTGELTIHGIKRKVTLPGTIHLKESEAEVESVFKVRLADHKIKIPKAVFYNIAEEVEVTVRFKYTLSSN